MAEGRRTTRTSAKRRAPRGDESEEPKTETDGVCPVAFCPVGLALPGVKRVSPDLVEHLLSSAREFLLAARAVIDARAADFDEKAGPTRLERIEIA